MFKTSAPHFPGLDTLRSAAILMVIAHHAWMILSGNFWGKTIKNIFIHGWAGVDLFFVLSGFLIASQLFRSTKKNGKVSFTNFYLKRFFRILPAYYTVLILYYLWPLFREKPEIDAPWRYALFVMNYGRKGEAFSHAWSLCVEEHFYLFFPLIVSVCTKYTGKIRGSHVIIGLLTFEAALRFYLWSIDAPFFPAVYRPSHTHLDGLIVGVALALLNQERPETWQKLVSRPWTLFVSGIISVAIGMGAYRNLELGWCYSLAFTFVSLGFGALVAAALSPTFWLGRVKLPGTSIIATLAFTLYLTHKQMIHMAKTLVDNYINQPVLTVLIATALIIGASLVLHFVIELPFLKLRDYVLSPRETKQ